MPMEDGGRVRRSGPRGVATAAAAVLAAAALGSACGGDTTGPEHPVEEVDVGLAVGESQRITADGAVLRLQVPGPGEGGAEYRLAVQSAARTVGSTPMRVTIDGGGTSSSVAARRTRRAGTGLLDAGRWRLGEANPAILDLAARARLQERARRMLVEERIRPARPGDGAGGGLSRSEVSLQLTPGEDTITLSFPIVEDEEGSPRATCDPDSAGTLTAEVKAVGETAAMVEDTETDDVASMNMDYEGLAQEFDDLVFGLNVAYFGSPTDIDGNGHVLVLFSPRINDLSDPDSQGRITGLFNGVDLADNGDGEGDGTQASGICEAGNEAELLYLVAPDPAGDRDAGAISADEATRIARSTSSHEFQHLLNAANRVIKQEGTFEDTEDLWLNEALSHLAEEVVGLAASDLALRSNLSAPEAGSGQGGEAEENFDAFLRDNLQNMGAYLQSPASTEAVRASADPGGLESAQIRGFGWIFLRWLADREFAGTAGQVPGEDPERTFFRGLAKADGGDLETGIGNVEDATAREWPDVLGDFASMPAVDDDVPDLVQRHRLLSWNMRQIFEEYPLAADTTGFGGTTFEFSVQAGGARHVFVRSSGSAPDAAIELTDQTGAPLSAGSPQITIVRTR